MAERAGTYEEVTFIFKANSNNGNTPDRIPTDMVTQCLHIPISLRPYHKGWWGMLLRSVQTRNLLLREVR